MLMQVSLRAAVGQYKPQDAGGMKLASIGR
jgi:hypothetical protein